ncbi:MAG: PEP-utilizing enzyme, partial [Candidatus Micrarchaeota archaeon]
DEWMLAEDIPNIDFFFCNIWLRAFVNNMKNSCGMNYSKILGVFHGFDMSFYYDKKNCLDFTLNLVKKMNADPVFGEKINENIKFYSDKLQESAEKIPKNLSVLSNEELGGIIEEHARVHTKLYEWGWLSNATDMFYPEFTELLKKYLRTKINSEEELNVVFIALTHADEKSLDLIQHEELLKIAVEMQDGKSVSILLEKYYVDYAPVSALWVGEPVSLNYFVNEVKSVRDPVREIALLNKDLVERRLEKEKLVEKLGIDGKYLRLFNVFGEFMITKQYRRYAQLRSLFLLRPVFREIAKRFNITEKQSRFLLTPEYKQLLVEGSFDVKQLAEREAFCVLVSSEGEDFVLTGEEARNKASETKQVIDFEQKELKGQCACVGFAKGRVKIILSPVDLPKMQKGDILVAIATNPDIVPAMKKAAAIVTEQGGVTCHAAIVSRELKIPCVIGTKIATKWLKDGDLVEVDASKGLVRKSF